MSDAIIVVVTGIVLVGVAGYLIGGLVQSIRAQRRSDNVRRIWGNFGLSLTFCALFLLTWFGQGLAEWGTYRDEQRAHGEPATMDGYLVAFGQSTLENWQSEFLQLFSFVVLSAVLIHRGSAESKDSDDRMEKKIDAIAERLDELDRAHAS
jgi:hypothetical protein